VAAGYRIEHFCTVLNSFRVNWGSFMQRSSDSQARHARHRRLEPVGGEAHWGAFWGWPGRSGNSSAVFDSASGVIVTVDKEVEKLDWVRFFLPSTLKYAQDGQVLD
jgi:hypothetical protein